MNLAELKNKNIAILGLGIEGVALADFLLDKTGQISVLDDRDEEKIRQDSDKNISEKIAMILDDKRIVKKFGLGNDDNLLQYDIIFRSPSRYFDDPKLIEAREKGIIVTSQIQLFFDLCPASIIGVTGTKGKGTTSSLLAEILIKHKAFSSQHSVFLAGNIGYPAITLIPEIEPDDIVILELSNFQLADLKSSPHIAVVTNLSVDHLDYHKSIEEYQRSKFNILKYQDKEDLAVLNSDSTFPTSWLDSSKADKKYFSATKDADAIVVKNEQGIDEVVLKNGDDRVVICNENEIKLYGKHNLENIAAASITADSLGVDVEVIKQAVREFTGLPHRTELIRVIDGVKYINDSFATNPDPTMAAIRSFKEDKILILGGSYKGSLFSELAKAVTGTNVKAVVLIGAEADKIKNSLVETSFKGMIIEGAENMDDVVKKAKAVAVSGDVILLSPACASFGMFKNYKDRGDKFRKAVENL